MANIEGHHSLLTPPSYLGGISKKSNENMLYEFSKMKDLLSYFNIWQFISKLSRILHSNPRIY